MSGIPRCELCGSNRLTLRYEIENPIFGCPDCGLLVSKLAWDGTDTAVWYSEGFFAHEYWQTHASGHSPDLPVYRRVLDRLLEMGVLQGRLLDVGCGLGVFLNLAKRAGFDVQGTEVSPFATERVRESLGIPVFLGELHKAEYPDVYFEVVSLWDVLEHVQHPSSLLREVSRILDGSGWLVLRVPSEDTLLSHIARMMYWLSSGRVKGFVQSLHEYYHLYYFTQGTLSALLEQHGFQILDRWGGEVHLSRVTAPWHVKAGMRVLYWLQALLGMQYEQVVIASKTAIVE